MWIDLSKWAKDAKILVSHVNAHQKVTLAKEEFNYQVVVSLFPKIFLSLLNGPLNEEAMITETRLCLGSTTWASVH